MRTWHYLAGVLALAFVCAITVAWLGPKRRTPELAIETIIPGQASWVCSRPDSETHISVWWDPDISRAAWIGQAVLCVDSDPRERLWVDVHVFVNRRRATQFLHSVANRRSQMGNYSAADLGYHPAQANGFHIWRSQAKELRCSYYEAFILYDEYVLRLATCSDHDADLDRLRQLMEILDEQMHTHLKASRLVPGLRAVPSALE